MSSDGPYDAGRRGESGVEGHPLDALNSGGVVFVWEEGR